MYIETVKHFVNIGKHKEELSVLSGIRGGIISKVHICLGNIVFHHTIFTSSLLILKSVPKVPVFHTMHSINLTKVFIKNFNL